VADDYLRRTAITLPASAPNAYGQPTTLGSDLKESACGNRRRILSLTAISPPHLTHPIRLQ